MTFAAHSPLIDASRTLARELDRLEFGGPVHTTYQPLHYAREPHERWLRKFGGVPKRYLLLGMNPGPFGMGQTGVPFGDVGFVRDWIGIEAPVAVPGRVHPKRPITGFACTRSEGSGRRLWGWARAHWGPAENFFADFFAHNYCPLWWVDDGGRNLTPDKFPRAVTAEMFAACDRALRAVVSALRPEIVFGVGAFAAARARTALPAGTRIEQLLHPSPASPLANKNWAGEVEAVLARCGVLVPPAAVKR